MSEKVYWCRWCRRSQAKGQVLFEHYAAGLGWGENFGPTWLQLLLNFMERSATVRRGRSAKRFSNSEVVLQGHGLFASFHWTLGVRSFPHKAWHGTGHAQNHYQACACKFPNQSGLLKSERSGRSDVTAATYEGDLSRKNENCKWQDKEQCPDELELNIHAAVYPFIFYHHSSCSPVHG